MSTREIEAFVRKHDKLTDEPDLHVAWATKLLRERRERARLTPLHA